MAFVKEKIPKEFLDSFDMSKLFVPYGRDWPIHTWTADHERRVAWIPITTDSNVAADEGRPAQTWYTMLLEGHVIGVLAEDGGELLPGFDQQFNRPNELVTLEDVNFLIPDALQGREKEIVDLATQAVFHSVRYPNATHERTYVQKAELRDVCFNGKAWKP